MTYRVFYTATVQEALVDQVEYLRNQAVLDQTIEEWFTGLYDAIDSLYRWPLRHPISEYESALKGFEIRQLVYGDYLVHYRVDQDRHVVEVLSFRHGRKYHA